MSDHAFEFLQSWIVENVKAAAFENEAAAEHLAKDCVWEAHTRRIPEADLIAAAGGDLDGYILTELNRTVDRSDHDSSRQIDKNRCLNSQRTKTIGAR